VNLFFGHRVNDFELTLSGPEAHHCSKVTRNKIGDQVLITEFKGIIWYGEIVRILKDELIIQCKNIYKQHQKSNGEIHIAISLTQHMDRFEWFVEKVVESGVDQITPILCERTEHSRIKLDRIQKIILESAKQTLRPTLPVLNSLISYKEFIATNVPDQRFICHCESGNEGFIGEKYKSNENATVLIGPAGDFTTNEIKLAMSFDYIPVHLGSFRLRTETAGIATCIILQTLKNLK